jgi:D-alanine-D-alanine ligase
VDGKKSVAVFFGAKSFEHDVSILTGLEVCASLACTQYDVFPVYVDLYNQLWTGSALLSKTIYPLQEWGKKMLLKTQLLIGKKKPTLLVEEQGLFFKSKKEINFDVAFCAFHGDYGENGYMQGLFEVAGIPYTGCRMFSAGTCMNKSLSKMLAKQVGVNVLPEIVLNKPQTDFFDIDELTKDIKDFPVIVKPIALGSSVGVSKANNRSELNISVIQVFKLGDDALIEPFVENLEEYNISVTKALNGKTTASTIERPIKKGAEFLGFTEKYMNGGSKKGGVKGSKLNNTSGSMINMTRVFEPPELTKEDVNKLKEWAVKIFDKLDCNGVVRIDFMCNSKTRELYFNEINTIPGSLAYYLWEASDPSYSHVELAKFLVKEALELDKNKMGDIILEQSKIFKTNL